MMEDQKKEPNESMDESKEKAFEQFNFDEDQGWKSFVERIVPEPEDEKLKKMKRRWYKIYHDIKFDTNYDREKKKKVEEEKR